MLKAVTSTIFALLLCCCVLADETCGNEGSPKILFSGTLDPALFKKLQITYATADVVVIPTINPTPSASGKIEVTVSSCTSIDVKEWLYDLANGADCSLFTLQKSKLQGGDKTAQPSSAGRLATPLPLLTALAALFIFPHNRRLSILALVGAFFLYTNAAEPITLYVSVSLPAGVTTICWNDQCIDLTLPTVAPTVTPTVKPTAAPTPAPTIPADIAYAFNLRVLVLADLKVDEAVFGWGDGQTIPDYYGADWVNSTFMSVGMPYDYYPTSTDLSTLLSTTGVTGKYSGIVYVKAVSAAIPAAQKDLIVAYQQKYKVKLVVVGSKPADVPGMTSAGSAMTTEGVVFVAPGFTQYAKTMRAGAQCPVTKVDLWQISYHTVQPGTVADATIATAALMFKPKSGNEVVAAAAVRVSDTDQLHYFIQQSTSNLHSFAMAPLMLNFISPAGVFMGARRLNFNVQPDDLFMSAYLWDTKKHESATTATNPPLEYRIVAHDMQDAANWVDRKNAELGPESYVTIEWPYNGMGSNNGALPGTDTWFDLRFANTDLFAKTMEVYEKFYFVSHTWSHPCPAFDTETYEFIHRELSYNHIWAENSFLPGGLNNPRLSKDAMVAPCITGLHNPNLWKAMEAVGIKFHVGDNSEPYKTSLRTNPYRGNWTNMADNGFIGGFIIPREVYAIDVGNSVPEEFTDQWNTEYNYKLDFEGALDYPVTQGLFNLIAYRQDPHMFHEANVRQFYYLDPVKGNISISLMTLWMDRVIDGTLKYFDLPVKSPKFSEVGSIWINRMAMDDCGFNAEMLVDVNGKLAGFTATSANSCVVQLTGVNLTESTTVRMEKYGADNTAYVTMTAGVSQTLRFTTPLSL